ncbi:MAG: RNA polymerase sigma factor [Planctomycetes bacterium]|nr:RNA polymerase sigma factor [Planctomycetota bacterium]
MPRSAVALARLAAASAPADTPDAQLLRAFVASGGDDAFSKLVRRHGPMVLAACRRVLSDAHDAEDAFQATFLVLARRAASVRGANVAGWLYAVAVRTARGVRLMRDRRRKRERAALASGGRRSPTSPMADADTAAVIDEELANLPALYRNAVVLCELRGLSRREAAAELGVAEGTLSSRLAAAKRKLADRLLARGLAGVALATALAPAAVSAALLEATAVTVRGAAGGAAGAAASTVLKGLLFDQLRATVLTGAVLVAAVSGGLALTHSPDAPPEKGVAPAPRPVSAPAAKLVEQLGSAAFAERESAQKALRALGLKAEPALKVGLKSDDPEIRARCAVLLTKVREDALAALVKDFDPAAEIEPVHPIWERFKSVAGHDKPARKLFAELIADRRRLKLLDEADRDPAGAGTLYAAELERWYRFVQSLVRPNGAAPKPGAVAYPDAVAIMYLGTFPSSAGKAKGGWGWEGHLFIETWGELVASPVGPPVRRIFAAWLSVRDSADARERGLAIATNYRVREVVPFARGVLADEKEPPLHRAQAALLLGVVGGIDDLPRLRRAAESERANRPFDRFNVILKGQQELNALWGRTRFGGKVDPEEAKRIWKEADVRTCDRTIADCAWAAAVRLGGGRPEELGFCWSRTVLKYEVNEFWFGHVQIHGFPDDTSRATAHAKAKAFLARQKEAPKEPK